MKISRITSLVHAIIITSLLALAIVAGIATTPSAEAANSCTPLVSSKAVSGTSTSLGGAGACVEKCTAYAKTIGVNVNCQSNSTYVADPPIWMFYGYDPYGNPMEGWWYPSTGTYVESCSAGTGAIVNSASNVSAASCNFIPAPSVNLTSSLATAQNGQSVILNWTSTSAVSCSGVSTGPTAGSKTQVVNSGAQSSVTYTITCLNSLGESASDSVTIAVANPNTPASCSAWDPNKYPTGGLVASVDTTGLTACAAVCGSYAEGNAGVSYSCGLQTINDIWGIGGHNYNGSGGIITTTNKCNVMSGSGTGAIPPTTGTYEFNNASYPSELAAGTAFDNCIKSSNGSNPVSCLIDIYSVSYYGATTCTSAPTGAPDLRAANVRPVTVNVGVPVTLIADISNTGTAPTPSGFTNRFQISSNSAGTAIVYTGTSADLVIGTSATDPSSHSYTFSTGGTFYVQVCADSLNNILEGSNEANNCSPWTAVTVSDVPPIPVPTAAPQACSTGQVSVSWNSVAGATSYQLRNGAGTIIYNGAATSFSHTGLAAGSSQSYTVRATNAVGSSLYSLPYNTTAPLACNNPPTAPTINGSINGSVSITRGADLYVDLRATDPDGDNITYGIDLGMDGGDDTGSPFGTPIPSGTTQNIHAGQWNTVGTFNIQARTYDASLSSTWTPFTISVTPAAPVPAAAPQACGTGAINVTWASVTGAAGYDLQYRQTGSTGAWTAAVSVTSPRAVTGLSANVSYDFQVRSKAGTLMSAWSSYASVAAPGTCAQPNLTAVSLTRTGTLEIGQILSLTGTVRNNSTVTTGVGFSVAFEYRIGDSGAFAGFNNQPTGALAASGQSTQNTSYTIPAGAAAQNLYLQYCVDTTGVVPESDESIGDNCKQINLGVIAPPPGCGTAAGGSYTSAPAANQCSSGALAWTDQYPIDGQYNWTCGGTAACIATVTTPPPPTLTPGSCGTGNISASWSAVSGATSYDIQYRLTGSTGAWTSVTGATSPLAVNSLTTGASYDFQLRYRVGTQISPWSAYSTANAPAVCSAMCGAGTSDQSLVVGVQAADGTSCTNDIGIARYTPNVYAGGYSGWASDLGGTDANCAQVCASPGPTNRDSRFCVQVYNNGTTYSLQCSPWASDGGGWSGYSADKDIDRIEVKVENRDMPPGRTVGSVRAGIQLAKGTGGACDNPGAQRFTPIGGGLSSWAVDGSNGDFDCAKVYIGGTVSDSLITLTATPQACSTGQINLSWNSVATASGYDIQINGGAWTNVGNVTTYNHTGLTAGSAQNYRVRAWNASGAGAGSSLVNATAPAACAGACGTAAGGIYTAAPAANQCTVGALAWTDQYPTDGGYNWTCGGTAACIATVTTGPTPTPTPGSCGTGSMTVTWATVSGATSYDLQYRPTGSTGAWTSASTVTNSHPIPSGLTPGTSYDFQVRYKSGSLTSPWGAYGMASAPGACSQPNLTSEGLIKTSGTVQESSTINLAATVRNNGAVSTGVGFSDVFEYRYGASGGFANIKTEANSALAAGATNGDTASYTIPAGRAGQTLYIQHCIDSTDMILESNESVTDNCEQLNLGLVSVVPVASGDINVSTQNCTIPVGEISCALTVTWSTLNTTAPYNVTKDAGSGASSFSTAPSGSSNQTLQPGSYLYRLYHSSATLLDSILARVECITGSTWNGSVCAAVPVDPILSISANPSQVQQNGNTTISWQVGNPYPGLTCDVYGPKMTSVLNFTPSIVVSGTSPSGSRSATGITAKSVYTIQCDAAGVTFTKTATVETQGVLEEI